MRVCDDSRCSPRRLRDILCAAMADRPFRFNAIELAGGGRVLDRGAGIVELVPVRPAADAAATVISAGIHGNETAPLELLLDLAGDLDNGCINLGAPVLLIVGHPAAIVAERRYIDTNLNRLFSRETTLGEGCEHGRARELMAAVDAFWSANGGPAGARDERATPLHLDLHTAIRASRYPRFAVEPFSTLTTPMPVWRALAAAGLQAVLSQHAPSPTFSRYSRVEHGIIAFTLELGRVARFGANDLAALAPMADWLAARVAGVPAAEASPQTMTFFRVVDELRRVSGDFALGFDDDVANFTPFEVGAVIARDAEAGDTVVADAPVHVVFPNANVERGARAALLARPVSVPRA